MKKIGWYILPLLFFSIMMILFIRGLSLDPRHMPSVKTGKPLPDFRLPSLSNPLHPLTAANLKGKVALLNVFASWCGACTEEQSFLLRLSREGIVMYGLNYKDEVHIAKTWLKTYGNPYRFIVSDIKGSLAMDLGVYGAPETFVIDSEGIIQYRHVGVLTEAIFRNKILPLMRQLEKTT